MEKNTRNIKKVSLAVDHGIKQYIESRRQRVPEFSRKHFSLKGALKLHKHAVGMDILKAPANIAWAVPSILLRSLSSGMKRIGAEKIPSALDRLPQGFLTDVQKEINWLIFTELLELPVKQDKREFNRTDALFAEILSESVIERSIYDYLIEINDKKLNDPDFRSKLEENLMEYATGRSAAADLAGNLIALATGAALHEITPGTIAAGSAVASAIAQQIAISQFWLGSALGSIYYGVFPATASTGLVVLSTGTLMALLAVFANFSGILTDPIQLKMGIHQKRLIKFIDALEKELLGKGESGFKLKDRYVARVFDIFDMLRTAVKIV